jgi:hypothetical protein
MASRLVDNLLAFKILTMLVRPFAESEAFKLGIIDANGKVLKKASTLQTTDERDAYNYLTRLVFNMKRIINRLPGGENKLKSIITAFFLVKECYEKKTSIAFLEEKYATLLETINENNITLVEEELMVRKFFEDVANVTGAAVSTNEPVIDPKKKKKVIFAVKRNGPMTQ